MIMEKKDCGVQKKIMEIKTRLFFVPCNSHSLNLAVNDAARCCLDATKLFNMVQGIFVFLPYQHVSGKILNHM